MCSGLLYRRLWAGAESAAYEHGLGDKHLASLQEVRPRSLVFGMMI